MVRTFFLKAGLPISLILTLLLTFSLANPTFAGEDEPKKAFLGIYPEDMDDDDREALDFKGEGILIENVVDDGPAEEAGIESGDILIEIEGNKIGSTKDLRKVLKKYKPNDTVKVVIIRNNGQKDYKVALGESPQMMKTIEMVYDDDGGFLGVVSTTVEDQLADYFKVDHGVLIKEVVEDTPAEKAGLRAGDVITKINDHAIHSESELSQILRSYEPETEVEVHYARDRDKKKVKVKLAESSRNYHFGTGFESFDFKGLGKSIRKMIDELDIEIHTEEMEKEIEKLKEELKELKKDMKEQKKEMKDKG